MTARMYVAGLAVAGALMAGCGSVSGSSSPASSASGPQAGDSTQASSSSAPASTAAPTTTEAPATFYTVGQPVKWKMQDASGTIVLNSVKRVPPPQYGSKPEKSPKFLVANFTIKVESGSANISSLTFEASDSQGNRYNEQIGVSNHMLDASGLGAGRALTGDAAYDIAVGDIIIDWNGFIGGPIASWKFSG